MILSDAHAHLYRYDVPSEDLEAAISRAKDRGVQIILAAGTDIASSTYTVNIATLYDSVYACIGIHPWYANTFDEDAYDRLLRLTEDEQVVAISEVGLDFVGRRESPTSSVRRDDYLPKPIQVETFTRQIVLAQKAQLPLIIHHNQSHAAILDVLQQQDAAQIRGAIHGFVGDVQTAEEYLNLGLYLSIGRRSVTDPAGTELLQNILRAVPPERLLIETDSNDPAGVQVVAERIAKCINMSPIAVGKKTTQNLQKLLGI